MKHLCLLTLLALVTSAIGGEPAQTPPAPPPWAPQPATLISMPSYDAQAGLVFAQPDGKALRLDLYVPSTGTGPFPLIVWIHGGGWVGGVRDTGVNKSPVKGLLPWRAITGNYAFACIDYRLSNAAHFPAQLEDCKAAIRWLRAHAAPYKLDPDRIGVWGGSAGGHLVALLGTTGDIKTFDVGDNTDVSSRVQAVCDFFGPTDFIAAAQANSDHKYDYILRFMAPLLGGAPLDIPDKAKAANPITYIAKNDPPFLIVHGTADGTVPVAQSQLLYDALIQAGVEAQLHLVPNAGHGGSWVDDPTINALVQSFFDQHLKKSDGVAK